MARVIRMTPEQFAQALRDDRKAFEKQILASLRSGARRGKEHLRSKTPVSFGTLRASWDDRNTADGAVITNDAVYAAAVEGGTSPYNISREGIDNLILWAMQKFGITASEARSVAFGVAKKLAMRGQTGKFFVRNAMATLQRMLGAEIRRNLGRHRRA